MYKLLLNLKTYFKTKELNLNYIQIPLIFNILNLFSFKLSH